MSRTLGDLSTLVSRVSDGYAAKFAIQRNPDWYVLKLQEEVGELVAEYLRVTQRGRRHDASAAEIERALADEAADVLATVLLFARQRGIDLEAALDRKWFPYLPPEDANG